MDPVIKMLLMMVVIAISVLFLAYLIGECQKCCEKKNDETTHLHQRITVNTLPEQTTSINYTT